MFRVRRDPITKTSNYTVKAAQWQAATDINFNDDSIVFDSGKDEVNINEIMIDYTLNEDTILYVRSRYYIEDNDGNEYVTKWTKPIMVTKNMEGFVVNNVILSTPKIRLDYKEDTVPLGGFKIHVEDFYVFKGNAKLESVDYVIEDLLGNKVFERYDDKHNLDFIRVPFNILKPDTGYVIKVRFRSNNNVYSNWGKKAIKTTEEYFDLNEDKLTYSDVIAKMAAAQIYATLQSQE